MKVSRTAVSFVALLALAAMALSLEKAKVVEVEKDPSKFDNKKLEISGKVDKFEAKVSRKGNDYFVFDLVDGKAKLHVYGQGKLEKQPKNGDKVTIKGLFRKEKKLGDLTFKNEVDVSTRIDKEFGIKLAK